MNRGLLLGIVLLAAPYALAQEPVLREIVDRIDVSVVRNNRDGKATTWFHPRGCLAPTPNGTQAFMTLQSIHGSDSYGPVHWSVSTDNAKTWSDPQPIPGMGLMPPKDGIEEGVCDVVPDYHAKSGTILAMGHNVYNKGGKFYKAPLPRWPVYVVRRPDGTWSDRQRLHWDDPRCDMMLTAGCAQKVMLADGDILVPVSFGSKAKGIRSVTTLLCSFDGKTLAVKKAGRELPGKVGRGLLEPSLTKLDGVYYLTIRAEDNKGYVSTSRDGLTWSDPTPWAWKSGETLTMSTTQQHWLTHGDALYLVYTRKSAENPSVFRWRAPLYLALVDRATLRLVPETEWVVFPIDGDGVKVGKVPYSGNFHTMPLNAQESLITDGEHFPANRYRGNQLQARILWRLPNKLVE